MTRLVGIYGASGFGREVLPIIRAELARRPEAQDALVFVDDSPSAETLNGCRVYTPAEFLALPAEHRSVAITIADGAIRERVASRMAAAGVATMNVLASNVVVMDDVQWGEGAVLCPFVTLTSNIRIGRHFHANLYSYVAHDCVIGDFVTFAPSVKCNGNVHVEDYAYIGTGAVIRQGKPGAPLVIGKGAVIGMGAVVTKSVAPGAVVVGNPARPMQP